MKMDSTNATMLHIVTAIPNLVFLLSYSVYIPYRLTPYLKICEREKKKEESVSSQRGK